ncbi:MAG: hypothetical protein AAB874_00410 [Patescibacteria group bacterium]
MKNQVTLSAIRKIVTEVVEAKTKHLATTEDLKNFATKEDLKKLATKEDLKRTATKEELKKLATKEDLKMTASKEDLIQFKGEILKEVESLREDNAILTDHSSKLEDHENRISTLEKSTTPRI